MKKIKNTIIILLAITIFFINSGAKATTAQDEAITEASAEAFSQTTIASKTTKTKSKKTTKKKSSKKKTSTKKSSTTNAKTVTEVETYNELTAHQTINNESTSENAISGVLATDCETNPELCEGLGSATTTEVVNGKTVTTKTGQSTKTSTSNTSGNTGSTGGTSTNSGSPTTTITGTSKGGSASTSTGSTSTTSGGTTVTGTSKGGASSTGATSGSTSSTNNDEDISSLNAENCYGFGDVIYFATLFVRILQITAPILLIIWASIDLFKSIIAGDEKKIVEMRKPIISRFIAAAVIFLVPWIVYTIVNSFGSNAAWLTCWQTYGYKNSK